MITSGVSSDLQRLRLRYGGLEPANRQRDSYLMEMSAMTNRTESVSSDRSNRPFVVRSPTTPSGSPDYQSGQTTPTTHGDEEEQPNIMLDLLKTLVDEGPSEITKVSSRSAISFPQ